ncbi:MAG: hypothetical protein L0209_04310 [candidate division Zixibacteria bacterium]|nr:hypothetical protein [candidate division Zixibacteria bacterium]
MRKLSTSGFTALLLIVLSASPYSAQTPDPRDSIIIESKTVNPGVGSPAAVVRVFITNKDTLGLITLTLLMKSISGGAYMTLSRPLTFAGAVRPLTNTLNFYPMTSEEWMYHSSSPDTFVIGSNADFRDPSTIELPNAVRKPFWEIKFDTVRTNTGTIWLDSILVVHPNRVVNRTTFMGVSVNQMTYWRVPVNFVRGVITVANLYVVKQFGHIGTPS